MHKVNWTRFKCIATPCPSSIRHIHQMSLQMAGKNLIISLFIQIITITTTVYITQVEDLINRKTEEISIRRRLTTFTRKLREVNKFLAYVILLEHNIR